jgi:hypothetical protein
VSSPHTHALQSVSVHETPSCALQQSPGAGHDAHIKAQSMAASSAQVSSQALSQQSESLPHTQLRHVSSPQLGLSCALQQSSLGAGVGVLGGVLHGHCEPHCCVASKTQVESQAESQHSASMPQTHCWHALSSHAVPSCARQQSPPGVGVASGA